MKNEKELTLANIAELINASSAKTLAILEAKIQKLDTKIDSTTKSLETRLEAKIDSTTKSLETRLEAKIDSTTKSLGTRLEAKIDSTKKALEEKIDASTAEVARMSQNQILKLEDKINIIQTDVAKIKTSVDKIEWTIIQKADKVDFNTLEYRMEKLEEKYA